MEEWKEYKLGDVCLKIGSGATPSGGKEAYKGGHYSLVRSQNVLDFSFSYDGLAKINETQAEKLKNVELKENDVLLNITGDSVARACILPKYVLPGRVNQHVAIIRPNKEILDFHYLLYFLQIEKQKLLSLAAGGATRNALTKQMIENYIIKLPPLPTQQKIAAILSSLDDKIELNNKINTNLEQQAQALFKNWFIDFEPFGGKMPEGWKVGKLSDIAEITMGQSPDGKSYNEDGIGTVFYQGRAEFGTRFPTRRLFTTEPKRIAKKFDTLMSVRAPVGDLNIANEDCCIGRGLAAIHSKDNHQSFVHYTVVFLRPQLDVFNGEGTVFGCINRDALNDMEVVIPTKEDLDKFEKIVASLDADIYNRSEENDRLKNIRDTLLPKLMNGEIEV